jgi:hypothetical protein
MPASTALVAVLYSDVPLDVRLTVEAAQGSAHFDAIHSVRSTTTALAFALSVLDQAAVNTGAKEKIIDVSLRALLAGRLERHVDYVKNSSPYELASALSSRGRKPYSGARELTTWIQLNHTLAHFLAAYQHLSSPSMSLGTPRGRPLAVEVTCPYCGMLVTQRISRDPVTGMTRRVSWCTGCAFISDTSDAVHNAMLEGPKTLAAGSRQDYTLVFDGPPVRGWTVIHACLRVQRTPWATTTQGPFRDVTVQRGEPYPPIRLTVELRHDIPAGIHYLVAAVAAQGDLWICRRPVFVEPATPRG